MKSATPPTPLADSVLDCPDADCGFSTNDRIEFCPRCGKALQGNLERIRYGSLMVAMGGILTLMMAFVILGLVALAIAAFGGFLPSSTRVSSQSGLFLTLCVAVVWCFSLLGAGVAFFNAGRYQQATGERDKRMIKIAIWLIFGGIGFMGIAQVLIGD